MQPDAPTLAIAVADGQPIFEVAIPCQMFGSPPPGHVGPWYEVMLCGDGGSDATMRGSADHLDMPSAFGVRPTHDFDDLRRADTVVVPACPNVDEPPPDSLVSAVRDAHDAGARIVSLCSGAFVLAAAGILTGRSAAMHWKHAAAFTAAYPDVVADPSILFIDHGDVLTGAGNTAGIDLCLHLLRTDFGSAVANSVARQMIVPPQRTGGQAQYIESPSAAPAVPGMAALLEWATANLAEPLTVDQMAHQIQMSRRTFIRRFTAEVGSSPLRWLMNQRVNHARDLLEQSDLSIEQVARRSGLGSPANLRAHFTRTLGVAPRDYRRSHRHTGRH